MGLPRQAKNIHRSTAWIVLTLTALSLLEVCNGGSTTYTTPETTVTPTRATESNTTAAAGKTTTVPSDSKTATNGTTTARAVETTTTTVPSDSKTATNGTTTARAVETTTTTVPSDSKTATNATTTARAVETTTTTVPSDSKTATNGTTTTRAVETKTTAAPNSNTTVANETKTASSNETVTAAAGSTAASEKTTTSPGQTTSGTGNRTTASGTTTSTTTAARTNETKTTTTVKSATMTTVRTTTTTTTTTKPTVSPPPPVIAENVPKVQETVEQLEAAAGALSPEALQGISAEEMEKVRALYDRVLLEYQQQLAVNTELQTSFENAVDLVKVELTVLKPHQLRIQNDFGTDLTPYFDTSNWESNKLLQYAGALTANYEKENTGIAFRDAIATVMNPVRNEVLRVRVDKPYLPEYADKASEAFLTEQQKFCETLMSRTRETGNAMTRCSLANITPGSTIYYASTLTMVTTGTNPLKEVLSSLETVDGANVLSSSQVLADYLSTQPPAIQEYYGAMSRLVHASNTEKIVAAAEEYDSRVLTSSLNLTSPMVNDAKKVYASLQMIYQILMGRTKYSALSGCFATPTEYVSELIFFGKTRRLYLEEKLAQVGVTDVSPYVDEADSNRNLLHRFHRALANSYFLEYSSNSNYSFLPDICAVTKPLKLEYHKFKINSGFDMALKDNTSSVFQEYQNDVCGQLISKTTESKTGMIMSCGIKHAAAGSIVLDVDTTTLVTTTGADPATTSATALRRIMGGVTYNQKNTVYNDEALMSTQEIAAREAARAEAARSIPEEEEVVITEATSKKFYTVTIPSIIGMVVAIALLLVALACCVSRKDGKD